MTKRIEEIQQLLLSQKRVTVNELSRHYAISTVSIRKDLAQLEGAGIARRIYGGAVLAEEPACEAPLPGNPTCPYTDLAELACQEIQDGDNIFLGSGVTCGHLAKKLIRFRNLSIVTTNITALNDLVSAGFRVYLLGGEVASVDGATLFSSPENPRSFVDRIHVDKAFTSISGVDAKAGLTVNSVISTYAYRSLPSICRSWYLIADCSKFDRISMYTVANLDAVSCLITDKITPPYDQIFANLNTQVRTLTPAL